MLDKRLYQAITLLLLMLALNACNKRKQVFKVDYQMSSCYGSEKSELVIYEYNKDSIIAVLKTGGIIMQRAKLHEVHHPLIPLFVKELNAINEMGISTTTESYQVFVDGQTIKKVDNGSGWNGFSRLKHAIFATE
jgi:hypothetical protein